MAYFYHYVSKLEPKSDESTETNLTKTTANETMCFGSEISLVLKVGDPRTVLALVVRTKTGYFLKMSSVFCDLYLTPFLPPSRGVLSDPGRVGVGPTLSQP